jgi:hypothetical protein
MRTDSLIALKIAGDSPAALAASLKPVLGRAAAIIADALTAIDADGVRTELAGRLATFQHTIAESTRPARNNGTCTFSRADR